MKVKHCPQCGSEGIETSSGSAEYSHWVRYNCKDCSWSYKSGSGMGVGSKSKGKHPREFSTGKGEQSQLVETGVWCSSCETCAKPDQCRCVTENSTPFCKNCAKFSEKNIENMMDVRTRKTEKNCSICNDNPAELKLVNT